MQHQSIELGRDKSTPWRSGKRHSRRWRDERRILGLGHAEKGLAYCGMSSSVLAAEANPTIPSTREGQTVETDPGPSSGTVPVRTRGRDFVAMSLWPGCRGAAVIYSTDRVGTEKVPSPTPLLKTLATLPRSVVPGSTPMRRGATKMPALAGFVELPSAGSRVLGPSAGVVSARSGPSL